MRFMWIVILLLFFIVTGFGSGQEAAEPETDEAKLLRADDTVQEQSDQKAETVSEEDIPIFSSRDFSAFNPAGGLAVTLSTSAVSLGLFNLFASMGNLAYASYTETTSAWDAAALQHRWALYDTLAFVFLGTGVFGLAASIPLLLSPPVLLPGYRLAEQGELSGEEIEKKSNRTVFLKKKLDHSFEREQSLKTASLIALGTGIAALTATGLGFTWTETAYSHYAEARFSEDAENLHREVDILQYASIGAGLASAGGFTAAALFSLLKPDPLYIQRKIEHNYTDLRLSPQMEFDSSAYQAYCREQVAALTSRQAVLQNKLRKARRMQSQYRTGFWVSMGAGMLSLVSTGISLYFSDVAFKNYNQEDYANEADHLKQTYELAKTLSFISGGVSSISFSTAAFIKLLQPSETIIRRELREVEQQLRLYRWRMRE